MGEVPSYRASQAPDGTWTIFDVPVFAAHTEEREGSKDLTFTGKWLKAALGKATVREREGYIPPLHTKHHGEGDQVDGAGKFALRRVGPITHGGVVVQALFADLIGVRPEVYARIRKGELSYRSVEILDVSKPEIDSLALLDDEVPFFRFPLLRLEEDGTPLLPQGAETPAPLVRVARGRRGPVLAYAAHGHGSASLFQFKETPMKFADEKPEDEDEDEKKASADSSDAVLEKLAAILSAWTASKKEADDEDEDGPGPKEQPAPAPEKEMKQSATPVGSVNLSDSRTEGENAALRAQVASLTAKFETMEANRAVDAKSSDLKAKGFSPETVSGFVAKARDQGLKAALNYAAGLESAGAPSEPPTHWTGEVRSEAPDPTALAKYSAAGPEVLTQARDLFASWKRSGCEVAFDDYFEANADPDAFVAG